MAVHSNMGGALKLGLMLGKKLMAYKVTGTVLAISLGTTILAAVAGSLLVMQLMDFENPDEKKQKADQTQE